MINKLAMLPTLSETLIALILALSTLASLPTDFLRRLSSPLLVFAFLNASLLLLSLRRISPHASIPPPVAAEFEIQAEQPTATDDAIVVAVVPEDEDRVELNSVDGEEEIVIEAAEEEENVATPAEAEDVDVVTATDESDEEVVEELSTAEFNRIIEAFLEKQKRFHYQENLSILV